MATQHPEHHVILLSWGPREARRLEKLIDLLSQLPAIQGQYRCSLWTWGGQKSSDLGALKQRLFAPVDFRAQRIRRFLRQEPFRNADEHQDPEVTLIAYGRSCRVVKRYLVELVRELETDWRDIRRVRQVIFVSPRRVRRVLAAFWTAAVLAMLAAISAVWKHFDPSASSLCDLVFSVATVGSGLMIGMLALLLNAEATVKLGLKRPLDTHELDRTFEELIENGDKKRAGTWPIPARSLPLDDLSATIETAEVIADAIDLPLGHKNVYEVASDSVTWEIGPIDAKVTPPDAPRAFDNRARRIISVSFSRRDNTQHTGLPPYDLRYRTNGYMELKSEPVPNLWSAQERGDWLARRQVYHYMFRPAPGLTYELNTTIYGGFNQGDRCAHSHLDPSRYIRRLECSLDLRPYLLAGWTITRTPELFYFPPRPPHVVQRDRIFPDENCDCLAAGRSLESGRRLTVDTLEPGKFRWTVYSVRNGGTLGFLFDVSAPAAANTSAAKRAH
jgi:hypothetical protein